VTAAAVVERPADLPGARRRPGSDLDLNFEPAEDYSEEQIAAMRARMTPHLAAKPRDGLNTVLVGHDDPFEAATGIYPEPMGVAFVVRPDGAGGFTVLADLTADEWVELTP
jgi:hypothetical protein